MIQPYTVISQNNHEARPRVGLFLCPKLVMHMDAREFVYMCGRIASKHDTAMAHAMLHAVALWVDRSCR